VELFPINSTGVKTHRDEFCIDFDLKPLNKRILDLISTQQTDDDIRELYGVPDTYGWSLGRCRKKLREDSKWKSSFTKILYRPFDWREIYFSHWVVELPRIEVSQHFINKKNLGIVFMRQVASDEPYSHFAVTRSPVDNRAFYSNRGTMSFAPLYRYDENSSDSLFSTLNGSMVPNLGTNFVRRIKQTLGEQNIESEDIFHYMYGVFHSRTYRNRYAEFLKIDFPRLPLTSNIELFRELCALGKELVALHLLESPLVDDPHWESPVFFIGGEPSMSIAPGYPKFEINNVMINDKESFKNVPEDVWNFHVGGYQVCHKWLKDRRGRQLSKEDIVHYQKIVYALGETINLMG
jgi:predicted helicase